MSEATTLTVEVLSGPLDGAVMTISAGCEWQCETGSPLSFPWDEELGNPQASFEYDQAYGWQLRCFQSSHGTYRMNRGERLSEGSIVLAGGDILKASDTWLLVRSGTGLAERS